MKLVRIVIILGDNSDPKWSGLSESCWVGLQICQGSFKISVKFVAIYTLYMG